MTSCGTENSAPLTTTERHIKKLTVAGLLASAGVLLSGVYIPFGPTKCFPFQHTINAFSGILLGPWWAASIAFVTSFIRNMMGTGSLFAFPGSIPGALMVGFTYRLFKKDWAALAEPLGTGPIGATLSALVIGPAIEKTPALGGLQMAFLASSIPGALLGYGLVVLTKRMGLFKNFYL
ncbi:MULTISPECIES: energy coupling factor transporter S component ThiW [Aminobacterium]|jgi:energy coupling factor transporter S component ThiW|uniref:energy coupling factor transporter S component ThiW n=1 Tax=Aminobacterium TaxID=81466 RepID=UPI00257A6D96|nr:MULTISPECIES: energy coupling factor transporter S component ThiW [unclassified Aminobacterium]